MNYETVIIITVIAIGGFLSVWGASLVVRALASRAYRLATRMARRIPKSINTAPPHLSRLQFWFGMIAGPVVCLGGTSLSAFVISTVLMEGEPFRWSTVPPLMLMVLAGGALVVGLRWDKAKGRRRCPSCWYDYAGLGDGAACPECGNVPASARALARTRRSRPIILAAPVLLIAAWLTHMTPLVMQTSWRGFVPTTVLIAFFEHIPGTLYSVGGGTNKASLTDRVQDQELWNWQERWLGRRAAHLLTTSSDPRACARASYFAYWIFEVPDLSDPDATMANMLRVGLAAAKSTDPLISGYSTSILSQLPFQPGPLARAAFLVEQRTVLDRFHTPVGKWDHRIYGRLIANFASPSDEVVACVRAVALDPQWARERRDEAAVLLGRLASRDAPLLARLEAEYPASQGDTRSMLALAIVSSRVQQRVNADGTLVVESPATDGPSNSEALARAMRDPDVEIRRAAVKVPMATQPLTNPVVDWQQTKLDLIEVAKSDPSCAAIAIRSLDWSGVSDEVVPVIARILDTGSTEDVVTIAPVLQWSQMDADWMAIRKPLAQRLKDAALDQVTLTTLKDALTKLDVIAQYEAAESALPEAQPTTIETEPVAP